HFKNGNLFWVNDIDKIFHSTGNKSYVVNPDAPETYWYNLTLYETDLYNFNIDYDPNIKQIKLWVNLPVSVGTWDGRKKPVGMLGTGIDLTDFSNFVASAFKEFDAKITTYVFNDLAEITAAADYDLVFNKKLLTDHLGSAGAEIVKIAGSLAASNHRVFTFEGEVYLVSSIPEMKWYLAVGYPAPGLLALNSAMNAVYFGMLLLVLLSLFAINVFVARTNSALAEQNAHLLAANQKAEAASRAKSAFLAKMSHEIRTPMNAITGMSELILREDISPAASEYALGVKQAGANLLAIINDILDFSKIESGKTEIILKEYLFASLLNDVIVIIRTRLAEKPVCFVADIDSALPRKLIGDETRIRQILLNVLSNAVKYTNEGRIALTIGCEPEEDGRVILACEISDTGIGIRKEDMDKLFDDFAQFDLSRHSGVEGTGLGLAIVHSLCRAMGGEIDVSSNYGEGSVFTVRIPQLVKDGEPFALVENPEEKCVLVYECREIYANSVVRSIGNLGVSCALAPSRADFEQFLKGGRTYSHIFVASHLFAQARGMIAERGAGAVPVLMAEFGETVAEENVRAISMPLHCASIANVLNNKTKMANYGEAAGASVRFTAPEARVLIVDDIATNLKVTAGLLAPYEMVVEAVNNGKAAICLARKNRYDMIFMDHMMPEVNGVEATVAIRSADEAHCRSVPIVALTANAVSGMKEMFLEMGFSDYLAKPIETASLHEIVERYIPQEKRRSAGKNGKGDSASQSAGF
ncbi:MAG: response regulator, partial [Zoogloeaceae bacterium]|nr:response regulator [Zoogloeaceae bacterium]